jgi:hypothetical protein
MPHSTTFSAFSASELAEKYRQIPSFRPTIGIIFSSIAPGIPDIVDRIRPEGIPVFGCSTAGEILVDGEADPFHHQSAVCCFMDLDPALFCISLFERGEDTSLSLGQRIGAWGCGQFARPAFIIAIAGLKNDGEAIVRGILQAAGRPVPLFGGMAGDDALQKDTMVFTGDSISHDGAVALVFDADAVDVRGIASSGWAGIGADMRITSAVGNTVFSINGRPATEVYKEYLDVKDEELLPMGINFPLLVRRPDGTEVLRAFMAVDFTRGALIFAGSVPEGSSARFSSSFGYQTIEKAIRELAAFHADHPHADLLLLFSCLARYRVAGAMAGDEILAASRLWHAPLAGFLCYGEIGHNPLGTCDFYNETLSLVLISLRK